MIRSDDLTDPTDKLLLEAHRAAQRQDWGACLAAADEVLKANLKSAEAMFLAGCAHRHMGSEGVAALLQRGATALQPQRYAPWLEYAVCMLERHPEEAYRAAMKAQQLNPDTIEGLSVLCNVSSMIGRHAEALEWGQRADALYGMNAEICHNKSFALMALGRWQEGWKEFRASLGMPNRGKRNYHADRETPRWNPSKHKGAVVVVHGEQGIGDEAMYASMLHAAIEAATAAGGRLIIECYSRNEGLFRRSFPDATVYGTLREDYCEWPAHEGVTHRLEMGGLGEFFGKDPFRSGAYLAADPAKSAMWRTWLNTSLGDRRGNCKKVGLAWTGGEWASGRNRRSIAFELILQLMRGQDCTFVNLEYEDRRKDLEDAPVEVLDPRGATKKGGDMDDLAALLVNLDLVISVQTSVVDYCGALGVPCWALADAWPQWRYTGFFGDDTMGFYEGVKVYRQQEPGAWAPVINRVARDLKAWTAPKNNEPLANGKDYEPVNDGWQSC